MSQQNGKQSEGDSRQPTGPSPSVVQSFVEALTEEERMLVVLRAELYQQPASAVESASESAAAHNKAAAEEKPDESAKSDQPSLASPQAGWDAMLKDLENRLQGKPYIFKLANRIQEDIERINKLSGFEREQEIDLADYVKKP